MPFVDSISAFHPAIGVKLDSSTQQLSKISVNHSTVQNRTNMAALGVFTLSFCAMLSGFPISAVIAMNVISPIVYKFEQWRATKAIDALAVKEFQKGQPVNQAFMDYVWTNPRALSGLTLQELSQVSAETKDDLLEGFFKKVSSESTLSLEEKQQGLVLLKILSDKGFDFNKNHFFGAVKTGNPEFVNFFLEKDNFTFENFNPGELLELWKIVNTSEVARLLVENGFNINAVDATGKTPLYLAIQNKKSMRQICLLLKNGAKLPTGLSTIDIKKEGGTVAVKLDDLFKRNPSLAQAFEEAKSPSVTRLSHFDLDDLPFYAFHKPAVWITDSIFMVRDITITGRTFVVAILVSQLAIPLMIFVPATFPAALSLVALPLLYYKYEWSRATKKLQTLAVSEFRNPFPARAVMDYIIRNEGFLDYLITHNFNVNKLGITGQTLLESICSSNYERLEASKRLNIFKKLANAFLNSTPEPSIEDKHHYVMQAINSNCPEFVEYLFSTGKLKADAFHDVQQHQCWMKLKSEAMAETLKNNGFDLEAKNAEGKTPLQYVFELIAFVNWDRQVYLKTLVKLGANLDVPVEVEQKNNYGRRTKVTTMAREELKKYSWFDQLAPNNNTTVTT